MEVINLPTLPLFNNSESNLFNHLENIATKVKIEPNFCIHHPDYQPFQFPDEVILRFQQLPLSMQHKFLNSQLCNFLYSIYYNGAGKIALSLHAESVNSSKFQNLENNTFLGVDMNFYDQLHLHNQGQGYFDPNWQVLNQVNEQIFMVKKGELTLHIECDGYLKAEDKKASIGDFVAIKMPPNLVQNGFYMAVGDAGLPKGMIVRIYFNLNPEGAVLMMGNLTQQLNAKLIPFTFKALYNPSDYQRYDSAVLYFQKSNYGIIHQILQSIYLECYQYFNTEVPLFTKFIAPGLAVAEEPDRKFAEKESFGLNQCQIITNSLLEAWQQGDESKENRMRLIIKHFSNQGIELERPYLNSNSQDIYIPLVSSGGG